MILNSMSKEMREQIDNFKKFLIKEGLTTANAKI